MLAALVCFIGSRSASADEPPQPQPKTEAAGAVGSSPAPQQSPPAKPQRIHVDRHPPTNRDAAPPQGSLFAKRGVPDYDGREEPTTAGDVLIWIPRVIVFPFYFFTEFIVRRPFGAVLTAFEQDRFTRRAFGIFSADPGKTYSFTPSFDADLGFLPAIGLYVRWDEALARKNHLRLHAETWGTDRMGLTLIDRYDIGKRSTIAMHARYSHRTDNLFWGLGPSSRNGSKSVFTSVVADAGPVFSLALTRALRLTTSAGVRATRFLPSDDDFDDDEGEDEADEAGEVDDDDDDQSIRQRVRRGRFASPPRFQDGQYTIAYQGVELALDSRASEHERGDGGGGSRSGVRLAVQAQPAFDVSLQRPGASWLSYGATASGHWEVLAPRRVLSLSVSTLFADPLTGGGGAQIPFTELASLGGHTSMRGFLRGRLVDRSAAVATLGYEWPVWAFIDANLHVAVGNVFGAGLGNFSADKLRLSSGFGIRTNNSIDQQFEIFTGFGTEPLEDGAAITSARLLVGATRAF